MITDRIRLRPLRREDSPLLYEWITDRELMILNAPYIPIGEKEHQEWFEGMLGRQKGQFIFVIEKNENEKAIGTCQLLNIHYIHQNAELQIRIGDSSDRGKGFGTDAVRLLLDFGFSDLNLHRIYLHVFSNNKRAIKSYEKCGFVKEGLLKEAAFVNGSWIDIIGMACIRQEHE